MSVDIRILTSAEDLQAWDAFVKSSPQGSLWQSKEWKGYQEALGRGTRVYAAFNGHGSAPLTMTATALVVIDRTTGNLATWEIPRGPIMRAGSDERIVISILDAIIADAQQEKALCLFLSPISELPANRYALVSSFRHIHPPATRIIDLSKTHDEILAQMHQKGRYNIKIALRDGVTVRQGAENDIDAFYGLLKSTSARDVFTISPKGHYTRFLTNLRDSFFLIAEHEGTPVAGYMGVIWNETAYYYYGASDHAKRALMAPYLLQWEAMKLSKERGALRYDLLGIAPVGSGPEHAWAGISSFKEKFGGEVVEYAPEQQIVLRPTLWKMLQLKRRILG